MPTRLTQEIINAAILGFEEQKRLIDTQIGDLRAILSGSPAESAATEPTKHKRRKMSAAGRARIAEAQRKRWAESKRQSASVAPEPLKHKRKLSRAGRAAIVAATKKRWALKRAEDAKAQGGAKHAGPTRKSGAGKAAKKTAAARPVPAPGAATKSAAE